MSKEWQKIWRKHWKKANASMNKRAASNLEWPTKLALIHRSLDEFRDVAGSLFKIADSSTVTLDDTDKIYKGQSSIVLSIPERYTRKAVVTKTEEGVLLDRIFESGACIVFHYTHGSALFQVLVETPKDSDSNRPRETLLTYATHDLSEVDEKLVFRHVAKFLTTYRVYSSLEDSSWADRMKVRYWMFMDRRNREQVTSGSKYFFTAWEIAVFAAAFAVANSIFALASMVAGYLALKP